MLFFNFVHEVLQKEVKSATEGITQDEEENEGVNSNSTDRSLQNSSISGQNFLALPSPENSELNSHNGEEMRKLLEKKELMMGPRPNGRLGHAHLLLRLVWDGRYEEVHKSEDDAFLHFFYSKCVKHAVGRKKWNVHHDELLLDRFVTYSDEAFAMLCIENYIGKLMDELRFPEMDKKSTRRTLYTEGSGGTKKEWTTDGVRRFVELCQLCQQFRFENGDRWGQIQEMVLKEEQSLRGNNNRKRKRVCDGEKETSGSKLDVEGLLMAMSNGSSLLIQNANAGVRGGDNNESRNETVGVQGLVGV